MSTPAFRSRWAGWDPAAPPRFPGTLPETEPAKPPKPGFEGFAGAIPVRIPGNHASPEDLEGDGCTSCGSRLFIETDLLCPACYQARRSPGRVIPFDPARRVRAEARLATRQCHDCGGSWWRLHQNGDSECESCWRTRAVTTEARMTDGAPAAGGGR